MKIAIRGGHNKQATGASGLIDELRENRLVYPEIIKYLKSVGHEVLDVTPMTGMSQGECLAYGVNKANSWKADLFISIHFNNAYSNYDGEIGTESCVYGAGGQAERVANAIQSKLGTVFKQRGVKVRPGLYELKNTKMPAIIVEICFVEATKDVEKYKNNGYEEIARLIASGIHGKDIIYDNESSNQGSSTINTNTFKIGNYHRKVKVTADSLNVRSGRGSENSIIGSLSKNSIIEVWYIDKSKDGSLWGSIGYNGKTGYIHLGYVQPI